MDLNTIVIYGASMVDEYADSGEFLDILSGNAWAALYEPVAEALHGLDFQSGPLIDLGAGSGRGVRTLAGLRTPGCSGQQRRHLGRDILINAACPGLVATDFTGFQGRPPQEAAATPIRLATLPDGGPTGSFFNDNGAIPW
jgi:hypothetical protein